MSLRGWREAAALDSRLTVEPCADGALITLLPMRTVFLGIDAGAWEQLTAALDTGFSARNEDEKLCALISLGHLGTFTLGARAAVDRRGALVVVSDRLAATLTPKDRLAWASTTQVVANGMLSVLRVAESTCRPVPHDEAQAILAPRPA